LDIDGQLDERSFVYHTRQALAHFYDESFLENSPLCRLLPMARRKVRTSRASVLRRLLREAIERLRPSENVPFGEQPWLAYAVVLRRYVHRKSAQIVADELAISHTTYYRYLRQGVEAVASMLWRDLEVSASQGANGMSETDAIQVAQRLARDVLRGPIDMNRFFLHLRPLLRRLAESLEIELSFRWDDILPPIIAEESLLRQAILGLFESVAGMHDLSAVRINTAVLEREMAFELQVAGPFSPSDLAASQGFVLARAIVEEFGGRVSVTAQHEQCRVVVTLPTASGSNVLIIDDDPDTVALYRRWLQHHGYTVQIARNPQEMVEQMLLSKPRVIVLDVLMPLWDGWSVLQQLKTDVETSSIQIIVCSVLRQPHLALALGASAVLQKPVDEETLLETIAAVLSQQGNQV